jgi:G3E family GTPase
MVDLILVMGFLGSGKTTFLENILSDTSEKVGVVVNEFGAVSVDGQRLKLGDNIDVMEVNSGSIFCACKVDFFIQSVYALMEMGIKKIYVEASGLSNPTSIEKIMNDLNTLNKTKQKIRVKSCISIADAERIDMLLQASVAAIAQIQRADIVLLNKMDNVDEDQKQAAIKAIKAINDTTEIHPCVMCAVDKKIINCSFEDNNRLKCIEPKPISERSFTIKYDHEISANQLHAFIDSIIPISVRIKGFLSIEGAKKYIDVVTNHIKITDSDDEKPNELVVIVYKDEKENAMQVITDRWIETIGNKPDDIFE